MIVAALGEETTSGAELSSSSVASTPGLGVAPSVTTVSFEGVGEAPSVATVSFEGVGVPVKHSASGSRHSKEMQMVGPGLSPSQVHFEVMK